MVTPVTGSPVAFGFVHTRRVASSLTLPVQPRERRYDKTVWTSLRLDDSSDREAEEPEEQPGSEGRRLLLVTARAGQRPGARSSPCVNATKRCDSTNRHISWLLARTPRVPRAIPMRLALMASAMP